MNENGQSFLNALDMQTTTLARMQPRSSSRNLRRATTTPRRTSSGFPRWPAGTSSRPAPRSPSTPSVKSETASPTPTFPRASTACSTMRWKRSRRKTPNSRAYSTAANPSKTRWPASPPRWASSSRRVRAWRTRSARTSPNWAMRFDTSGCAMPSCTSACVPRLQHTPEP